jgi:MerR family transcriptional regulator/heat shock protein HspR
MSTQPPRRTRRTTTRVEVSADRGVFMISVAAELAEMHPQTLRMYEARGLIEPQRSPKGTRLYSQADVERLRRIQEMTGDLGLNLAGVERVLEMEEKLERAQKRVEALERRAAELQSQIAQLEAVRERVRAELVCVPKSGDIVRAQDARSPFKIPIRRDDGAGGPPSR